MPRDKKTTSAKLKEVSQHEIDSLPELTPQQHKFMMGILEGMTAADAHREAYPSSRTWTDNALWVGACRLRADPKVQLWLKTVRRQAAHSHVATLEDHTRELNRLKEASMRTGNYGAAVQAEKARGQASGLYVDRNETRITADEDLVKVIKDLAALDPALARALAAGSGLEHVVDATSQDGDNPQSPVTH